MFRTLHLFIFFFNFDSSDYYANDFVEDQPDTFIITTDYSKKQHGSDYFTTRDSKDALVATCEGDNLVVIARKYE